MMTDAYEGWSNRETWATVLHMMNNEGLLELVRDTVGDVTGNALEDGVMNFWYDLLNREWWEDYMGGEMADWADGARTDIGSLWRVNWAEVAEAYADAVADW